MTLALHERRSVTTFRVGQRAGVWSVSRNERPYGEYLTRAEAVRAARAAACSAEALGSVAQVFVSPGETLIPRRPCRPNP